MPVELLQFGALLAAIAVVALLWFRLVYKKRRTGEGDGTPKERERRPADRAPRDEEEG